MDKNVIDFYLLASELSVHLKRLQIVNKNLPDWIWPWRPRDALLRVDRSEVPRWHRVTYEWEVMIAPLSS